jgi:hypothetical protein
MMEQMHRQNGVVALLTAALLVGLSQAFVIPLGTSNQGTTTFLSGGGVRLQRQQLPTLAQPWTTILYMAEKGDETTDEGTGDATAAAVEEEEEVLGADPELVALKAEIAKLEADVKVVRRKAADTSDRAEEYTKTGYARKVAEMENMRRARSVRTFEIVLYRNTSSTHQLRLYRVLRDESCDMVYPTVSERACICWDSGIQSSLSCR